MAYFLKRTIKSPRKLMVKLSSSTYRTPQIFVINLQCNERIQTQQ